MSWTISLRAIDMRDVSRVGGKNASLGEVLRELTPLGVRVPDGFAVTADAYRYFLRAAGLEEPISRLLVGLAPGETADLIETAHRAGRTVGICGQAPSDYPEFAAFLVSLGIDSLSIAPDVLVSVRRQVAALEAARAAA